MLKTLVEEAAALAALRLPSLPLADSKARMKLRMKVFLGCRCLIP